MKSDDFSDFNIFLEQGGEREELPEAHQKQMMMNMENQDSVKPAFMDTNQKNLAD